MKEILNKFIEIDTELSSKYYEFLKNLILTSSAILVAIVSLTDTENYTCLAIIFRKIIVSSIGLGIFFSSILLYGEIHVLKNCQENLREYINKLCQENKIEIKDVFVLQTDRPKQYKYIEITCFFFYFVFFVSLIAFGLSI